MYTNGQFDSIVDDFPCSPTLPFVLKSLKAYFSSSFLTVLGHQLESVRYYLAWF